MKHLATFCAVSAFLGLPYALKVVAPVLEPYPAIIFPSGHSKVDINDTDLTYSRVALVGFDKDTLAEKQLEPRAFLKPIPTQYLTYLAKNEFGLEADRNETIHFRYLSFPPRTFERRKPSQEEIGEMKQWLREKLIEQNCSGERFIIRRSKTTISTETGETIKREIHSEKTIALN